MINQLSDETIGGYGNVSAKVAHDLYDLLEQQHDIKPFNNGVTAAFWHIIATLNCHLKDEHTLSDD